MSISKEFLELFSKFIDNYKQKGSPAFYQWSKDKNHAPLCEWLQELLNIIKSNQDTLHDISIIDNLNINILLSSNTNSFLLNCWINFLNEYNSSRKVFVPLSGIVEIRNSFSGIPSESMICDLKSALISQQNIIETTRNVHQTELEQLKKQINELQESNGKLKIQNDNLKKLMGDREIIEASHQRIIMAQEQMQTVSRLLSTLYEATKPKTISESNPIEPVIEQSKIDKNIVSPSKNETLPIVKVDLPVPPPPPQPPVQKIFNTHSHQQTIAKESKPETKTSSVTFFSTVKNDQLLDGINSVLERMKKQKMERTQIDSFEDEEKKKNRAN